MVSTLDAGSDIAFVFVLARADGNGYAENAQGFMVSNRLMLIDIDYSII